MRIGVLRREDVIRLSLAVGAAVLYFRVTSFGYVNLDDPGYVATNARVQAGLSWDSVIWAFSTLTFSNWHPLTWLSLMLDCEIFGLNPFANHLVNLLLHVLNVMLLFTVLTRMTGAMWRSAFVAAVFAVHPLHVESVAWIAERKDVLSTFFWLLAMGSYARYVKAPSLGRYGLVLMCFVLGLLSKSMVVTLPCVLLLLDYWPLRRTGGGTGWKGLVWEKAPLFVLSGASCALTFVAQQRGGAMEKLDDCPLFSARIPNALVSYGAYLVKTFWPVRLAISYPHPGVHVHGWTVFVSAIFLIGVTALVLWRAKRSPYLIVGWLWYIGTLVPVIGLVQVGLQSMADRYTYVPLIGVFIMIAWGVPEALAWMPRWRPVLGAAAAASLIALSGFTWIQVGYWRSSLTLFSHTLSVTRDNVLAEIAMGMTCGQCADAERHFRTAYRLAPHYTFARASLGASLVSQGKIEEATKIFSGYLEGKPDDVTSLAGMADVFRAEGRNEKEEEYLVRILKRAPDNLDALVELSSLLIRQKRYPEAEARCREGIAYFPYDEAIRANLKTLAEIRRRQ